MYRITDPERSRTFYEALGFTFAGNFDIVRNGELETTNYFFSIGDQESVLELSLQPGWPNVRSAPGTATSRSAPTTSTRRSRACAKQGIEPERGPYSVHEGGSRLTFVRDQDG